MPLSPDPGGVLRSAQHRRVLACLSHPDDQYGWSAVAIAARAQPHLPDDIDLPAVLAELVEHGHAEHGGEHYRMTQAGFDALTGPAATGGEPGPAIINPDPASAFAAGSWEQS